MAQPNTSGICCETCRAFHPQSSEQGLCRRHAPQCNALLVMVKSIAQASAVPQVQVLTAWPTVKNGEGCLEYEPVPFHELAS